MTTPKTIALALALVTAVTVIVVVVSRAAKDHSVVSAVQWTMAYCNEKVSANAVETWLSDFENQYPFYSHAEARDVIYRMGTVNNCSLSFEMRKNIANLFVAIDTKNKLTHPY